jgi:hypothetical protein
MQMGQLLPLATTNTGGSRSSEENETASSSGRSPRAPRWCVCVTRGGAEMEMMMSDRKSFEGLKMVHRPPRQACAKIIYR